MKLCGAWPIGMCSWSLGGKLDDIAAGMRQLGLSHVHLGIDPALRDGAAAWLDDVRTRGWTLSATMIGFPQENYSSPATIRATGGIVPDAQWPENRKRVLRGIDVTAELGVSFLEFHFGFLDYQNAGNAHKLIERVKGLADAAAKKDVMLLMETGQETAADLSRFLGELNHPAVGVNFDPGNMILYGMGKPIEAVKLVVRHIRNVHIKDAKASGQRGVWGREMPWGKGEVGAGAFLKALHEIGFSGALNIEREQGKTRLQDIQDAVAEMEGFGR